MTVIVLVTLPSKQTVTKSLNLNEPSILLSFTAMSADFGSDSRRCRSRSLLSIGRKLTDSLLLEEVRFGIFHFLSTRYSLYEVALGKSKNRIWCREMKDSYNVMAFDPSVQDENISSIVPKYAFKMHHADSMQTTWGYCSSYHLNNFCRAHGHFTTVIYQ